MSPLLVSHTLDHIECFEECLQVRVECQHAIDQASAAANDLAGQSNEVEKKLLKLHPQRFAALPSVGYHQRVPGFERPGERRDYHVSPITIEIARRHPQRINAALELCENILLVATFVR